jgi:hypothetical protein
MPGVLQRTLASASHRTAGLRATFTLGLGLLIAGPLGARTPQEYDLKAAFLYNFATFTEWPAEAFEKPDSVFVIGVLGDDPFGSILDEIVNGEHIGKHPIVVARYKRAEEVRNCHIVFISASESRRMTDIIHRLQSRPVLTVSDIPGFAEAGGLIGFITTNSIGLKINPAAIQGAKLNISSKLLRLAKLVSGNPVPHEPVR